MGRAETNTLTGKIIDFILRSGGYAWRNNSLGIPLPGGRGFRPAAKRGSSDILGVYKTKALAIEIKTGTDRLREEQVSFLSGFERAGGVAMVVGSWEEFVDKWKDL